MNYPKGIVSPQRHSMFEYDGMLTKLHESPMQRCVKMQRITHNIIRRNNNTQDVTTSQNQQRNNDIFFASQQKKMTHFLSDKNKCKRRERAHISDNYSKKHPKSNIHVTGTIITAFDTSNFRQMLLCMKSNLIS